MAVALEKTFEPQHVAALRVSDDDRPAGPLLDHADAPHDQRVHDPLAEFRFGYQQRPQPIGRDGQGFHRPLRVGVQQHRPADELSHFPDHPAGADR